MFLLHYCNKNSRFLYYFYLYTVVEEVLRSFKSSTTTPSKSIAFKMGLKVYDATNKERAFDTRNSSLEELT